MSEPGQALQEQLMALVRAFGLHRPDQTPCGQPISVAEAHTLFELTRAGLLSQNELAARLNLEKSTVSRLVTLLEQRGWIARQRSLEDRRVLQLRLTEAGRKIAADVAAARRARFERLLQAIPSEARGQVIETLALLTEAMRENR